MRRSHAPLYAIALGALVIGGILLSSHPASAGTSVSVTRGSKATLHWQFNSVSSCSGVTTYPETRVKDDWENKTHYPSDPPLSFTVAADPGFSYVFTCTDLTTGAKDSATLTVTDCLSGTHWSGSSCVANVCPNGALASTYPTCNQCPDGQPYLSGACQTNACAGGCSGRGGSTAPGDSLGGLTCNNGASNPVACNAFAPSCPTLSVSKNSINPGDTVKLSWICQHVSSCTQIANPDGFSTGGRTNGSDNSVTPSAQSGQVTYGMTCDGSPFYFPPITILVPTVTITADPTRIRADQSSVVTWSASNVTSCIVTNPSGTQLASGNANNSNNFSKNSPYTTPLGGTGIYTITCKTRGADVSAQAIVSPYVGFNTF